MSWAPRWIVLKKFHLRIYKSSKLHVPSNNISLSGAKVVTTEEKEKQLTLICPDRSYTFKMLDVIERDNVVQLFNKAMEMRRSDGSIGVSCFTASGSSGSATVGGNGSDAAPPPRTGRSGSISGYGSMGGGSGMLTGMGVSAINERSKQDDEDDTAGESIYRRSSAPGNLLHSFNSTTQGTANHTSSAASTTTTLPTSSSSSSTIRFGDGMGVTSDGDDRSDPSLSSRPLLSRRKSRRTISRDFHRILERPSTRALALDEARVGSGGQGFSKIEFAEFAIDEDAPFIKPSKQLLVGVYAFMRLLRDSIAGGAHLSPALYVPKSVWYQHQAKLQSFQVKVEVLDTLKYHLHTMLPPRQHPNTNSTNGATGNNASSSSSSPIVYDDAFLSDQTPPDELERSLAHFRCVTEECQDKLAQHLAFIHTVKDPYRKKRIKQQQQQQQQDGATTMTGGGSGSGTLGSVGGSSSQLSSSTDPSGGAATRTLGEKLSKSMKTFGKIVTRAASASKDKVDQEGSTRYVKLLHTVFDQLQVLHEWSIWLDVGGVSVRTHPKWSTHRNNIDQHIMKISEFCYCVLCNMVIRDLKSLVKRYIKHCIRTLVAH